MVGPPFPSPRITPAYPGIDELLSPEKAPFFFHMDFFFSFGGQCSWSPSGNGPVSFILPSPKNRPPHEDFLTIWQWFPFPSLKAYFPPFSFGHARVLRTRGLLRFR